MKEVFFLLCGADELVRCLSVLRTRECGFRLTKVISICFSTVGKEKCWPSKNGLKSCRNYAWTKGAIWANEQNLKFAAKSIENCIKSPWCRDCECIFIVILHIFFFCFELNRKSAPVYWKCICLLAFWLRFFVMLVIRHRRTYETGLIHSVLIFVYEVISISSRSLRSI